MIKSKIYFIFKMKKNELMFDIVINFNFNLRKNDDINNFTLIFQSSIQNVVKNVVDFDVDNDY